MPADFSNTPSFSKDTGSFKTATGETWTEIDALHALIQKRTNAYVERLAGSKDSLQKHANLLLAMLKNIGDGLVVADNKGTIILFNTTAAAAAQMDLTGMTLEKWSEISEVYLPDQVTRLSLEELPMSKALKGITTEDTLFYKLPQFPEGKWLRINVRPILDHDNNIQGAVTVFHDMTDVRAAKEQRDSLAALITHDLKNHLVGESMSFDLLLDELSEKLTNEEKRTLLMLKKNSEHQLEIINCLMRIYRYEVGAAVLHLEAGDITSCLNNCVNEIMPTLTGAELTLENALTESLPPVSADSKVLGHVFSNLLGNAVKFTKAGGRVKIESGKKGNQVFVSVIDNGKGIPESELETLFKGVQPDHQPARPIGSTGLGLYLCRKILEAHAATITCVSEVNKGTTFTVTFPCA